MSKMEKRSSITEDRKWKVNPFVRDLVVNQYSKLNELTKTENIKLVRDGTEVVNAEVVYAAKLYYERASFVKFYELDFLESLKPATIRVFIYICKTLRLNEDRIIINKRECSMILNMAPKTIRACISELMKNEIIANSEVSGVYWINVKKIFKGERRTLLRNI